MTYLQALRYLESFINYEKIPAYPYKESLKLERIRGFLAAIGNPQDSLRCIHIAGSKGKGSVCAFLAYILRAAGYRVGLYTSPHLSDFRERIRILRHRDTETQRHKGSVDFEGMIAKGELARLAERMKPAIEKYNKQSAYGELSFFEAYTALAFVYFKKQKVDLAVLETGLGGRLDATNTVDALVSVITPISYEHTQKLGNTLREIAQEKAGIIKRHASGVMRRALIVVSAPQENEAREVIINKCRKVKARLIEVGRDIVCKKVKDKVDIKGMFCQYQGLKIPLLGEHQVINAACAIGAAEALRTNNIIIDAEAIKNGIKTARWPGRCEVISKNPLIVLDGAQNFASTRSLKQTIRDNFKYKRLILVLGVSQDKDIRGVCKELCDLADIAILTKANNPRASDSKMLARYFSGRDIQVTDAVRKALVEAKRRAKRKDLILVTGSLFVVGEARKLA